MRVLVVEQGQSSSEALVNALRDMNILSDVASNTDDAMAFAENYAPSAMLLSNVGGAAAEAVRAARRKGMAVPVLVIAETLRKAERMELLSAGADDVVTRDTDMDELMLRVQALARRRNGFVSHVVSLGRISMDLDSRRILVDGTELPLTRLQFSVFELLATRCNRVVTRAQMLDQIYGGNEGPNTKIVDVVICHLRTKLKGVGVTGVIQSVFGRGYQFCSTEAALDA